MALVVSGLIFIKEYGSCLVAVIKTKSPPVPKMFNFLAAMEYQYHFLLKKAGMCPHISYDELKKITLKSGMSVIKKHRVQKTKSRFPYTPLYFETPLGIYCNKDCISLRYVKI